MFGYSDLIVDPRNLVLMRDAGCPVSMDITHALQQPAGRALEVVALMSHGCELAYYCPHRVVEYLVGVYDTSSLR